MKNLKENDLLVLILTIISFAVFVSICIVAVKLILRGIYFILDHIDLYNLGWNVFGFVAFILLLYGTYQFFTHDAEQKYIKELTEMERNSRMMETMEHHASHDVSHRYERKSIKQKPCVESAEAI